jgi:geranylgeranyl diphosphate synthase type I
MDREQFLRKLEAVKGRVEAHLEALFRDKIAEASGISAGAEGLIRVLKEFTMRGGKRLRASLVYYGNRCFSDRESQEVWKTAMSLELVQSFLLIHDDVIDEDDTRRGGRTVHRLYADVHGKRQFRRNSRHFGESMAILCGDLALALANEVLGGLVLESRLRGGILDTVNRMVTHAIYGEGMDVLASVEPRVSEQEILTISMLKTASYTVEGPLHLGALLGGADRRDLERLSRYAMPLGKAFQVQDDILGLFGDAQRLGKPVGSDIREGKRTVLIQKAFEKASPAQRAFLERTIGNRGATGEDLERIRRLVIETGSLEACRELTRSLVEESRRELVECRWREEGTVFLEGALGFVVERES